jgi:hypothetical protein
LPKKNKSSDYFKKKNIHTTHAEEVAVSVDEALVLTMKKHSSYCLKKKKALVLTDAVMLVDNRKASYTSSLRPHELVAEGLIH